MNVIVEVKGKRASGRTTLINALAGMLEAKGFDITTIGEHAVSVVGDEAVLYPNDTNCQMGVAEDTTVKSALQTAHEVVHGDREKTYGDAGKNLRTIAAYWNTHLLAAKSIEARLTEEDVCGMMILLKQARLASNPHHRDSLVDIAGYTELNDITQQQKQKSSPY